MPLPLPDLDTRRWADLVEEGRALVPRYAREAWTDHNVHDPGITLMELFAWLIEQQIYRVNRVPDRHRRKFLQLLGFPPRPPLPSQSVLRLSLNASEGARLVRAGMVFTAQVEAAAPIRVQTRADLTVLPVEIAAVQSADGATTVDLTQAYMGRLPLKPWGTNPAAAADTEGGPALYLGLSFTGEPPNGEELSLRLQVTEPASGVEQPVEAPHHSVRTAWELFDGSGWRALASETDGLVDETRGLTLSGAIRFRVPSWMAKTQMGTLATEYFYLRCRVAEGRPDVAPSLTGLDVNAVAAEQSVPAWTSYEILVGASVPSDPASLAAGTRLPLRLHFDEDGALSAIEVAALGEAPEILLLDYQAPGAEPGKLVAAVERIGFASGAPRQQLSLANAPVARGQVEIWTTSASGVERWHQRLDLDASDPADRHFVLDPTAGLITFGDGDRGLVVPQGQAILALYASTPAGEGNVSSESTWSLDEADDPWNGAVNGADVEALRGALGSVSNPYSPEGGAEEEDVADAAGRAAEVLWAHERLVEMCSSGCSTLDQLDSENVLAATPPSNAVNLLDYERLALTVPGTAIARARAWAGIDPSYPCLKAPGTVAVVIVPFLPESRPEPTEGLLRVVSQYLDRRRVVGTRLRVVGPSYLEVSVRATVRARSGTSAARIRQDVIAALDKFLDPLRGGPGGRGWPFGRDVYRTEVLQVIDGVAGVDYVEPLELVPDVGEASCANLCVAPTWLVTPGTHEIEVQAGGTE